MDLEREIETMKRCERLLKKLDPRGKKRVSSYLADAYANIDETLETADDVLGGGPERPETTVFDEEAKDDAKPGLASVAEQNDGATVERYG